jgi:ZIP family zinc transporter
MGLFALIVFFVPEPEPVVNGKGKKVREQQNLMHVGMLTALGISLHNFPEGVAVYLTSLQGAGVGLPLAIAIAAHNIPEGMAVAAPIYHATGSRWQAFKWSLLSGLCEPAGAILIGLLMHSYLTSSVIKIALAGVAGVMTFMCFHELVPQSLKYISSNAAIVSNVAGMMFISLSVWFLQEKLGFKTP